MRLTASMIVRDEYDRYLVPVISHLLDFCDDVVVLDDGSTDGTAEWLLDQGERVIYERIEQGPYGSPTFDHEGRKRNQLLDLTRAQGPEAILSIDADEMVTDGKALRSVVEETWGVRALLCWTLDMTEVWRVDDSNVYWSREDGGWKTHPIGIIWRYPSARNVGRVWRVPNRALACGRVPQAINAAKPRQDAGQILHLGWANVGDRAARYQRYADADGGRFHANAHIESIMWPDERVQMKSRPVPMTLDAYWPMVMARAHRTPSPEFVTKWLPRAKPIPTEMLRVTADTIDAVAEHVGGTVKDGRIVGFYGSAGTRIELTAKPGDLIGRYSDFLDSGLWFVRPESMWAEEYEEVGR